MRLKRIELPERKEDALYFPEGTFFISSSQEQVKIPNSHVGYVLERGFIMNTGFSSHPNAPYIGPKSVFQGAITFENLVYQAGARLYQGMFQSILELRPLKTPLDEGSTESRYKGQETATLSRL